MKKLLIALGVTAIISAPILASAQVQNNLWKLSGGALIPVSSSYTVGNSSTNATFNNLTVNSCTGCGGGSGGSPAGISGNVQLNVSGSFGATPNFTVATSTGNLTVLVGIPTRPSYLPMANNPMVIQQDVNGYSALNVTNANTGTTASADLVFNNANSSDTVYYADFGFNGSGNSDPLFTGFGGANSSYWYNTDGAITLAVSTTSSSAGYINWLTGGTLASNEKMRLTQTGNLGIGTTTPGTKLGVYGDGLFSGFVNASIFQATSTATSTFAGAIAVGSTTPTSNATLNVYGSGINSDLRVTRNATGNFLSIAAPSGSDNGSSFNINGSASGIRLSSNGNVGIGSAVGKAPLQVFSSTTANISPVFIVSDSASTNQFTVLTNGNVGIGTSTPIPTSSGRRAFNVQDTTNEAEMNLQGTNTLTTWFTNSTGSGFFNRSNTALSFGTNNIERVRIDNSGNIGMGTSTPTARLTLTNSAGSIPFNISSTTAGSASTTLFAITNQGEIQTGGGTPTLSCAATCAFDAHSNDQAGTINIAGVQTSVTLTFSSVKPWAPHCVASDNSTANVYEPTSISTTAVTFSTVSSIGTGYITYFCPL